MEADTRTIESIDIDNRVRDRIPAQEGDEVRVVEMSAVGAWIESASTDLHEDPAWTITGNLHSDDTTFAFQEGIRSGRITLSE